jgi:plasmid replication initiation protein
MTNLQKKGFKKSKLGFLMEYRKRKMNYQSNVITKSKQQFSLQEQKVVAFIVNQIDHNITVEDGQNLIFEIPFTELSPYLEHKEIKKVAKSILSKQMWSESGEDFMGLVPFPSVKYDSKNNVLRVMMISDIVPYFIELGKQYTKYHLETFLSFSSVYSQRLYQMLMMYNGRREKTFNLSINKLESILNSKAHDFYDLKRFVLDVAQKEIAEKANLNFTYTPSKKEGKKIIELEFNILSDVEKNAQISENVYSWVNDFHKFSEFEQVSMVKQLLENQYLFSKKQRDEIMYKIDLRHEFIKLHVEIQEGKHKIEKSPTAFIAACLGFNKKKMLK